MTTQPENQQPKWYIGLLPLQVWYSPLLRLRYRAAVSRLCRAINVIKDGVFVTPPRVATHPQAHQIEVGKEQPPPGVVYVEDSELKEDTQANVQTYDQSAVINLPESENDPYSTIGVTTRAVVQLFGCRTLEEIAVTFSDRK